MHPELFGMDALELIQKPVDKFFLIVRVPVRKAPPDVLQKCMPTISRRMPTHIMYMKNLQRERRKLWQSCVLIPGLRQNQIIRSVWRKAWPANQKICPHAAAIQSIRSIWEA